MAQASKNSTITSEAFSLLDCFVSGLDDVIYEIAESIADANGHRSGDGSIEITRNDIRDAVKIVFDAIKQQAGTGISQETVAHIEEMHACVMQKCGIHPSGK